MRIRWLLLAVSLLAGWSLSGARAAEENPSIFRRFGGERVTPEAWQLMPELPVYLRPQTDPDAHISQNSGMNLVVAYRPGNRIYFSRGYDFAQMTWEPKTGSVREVQLTSFDISEMINFSVKRVSIITFGFGLGVMDGLIRYRDDGFLTRLEPFIPIQLGLGFPTGTPFTLGLKLSQHFFLGHGPVVSVTRGLIGIGYNF